MDNTFVENFTQHWLEAWNSHDIEMIISHYAEQLEFKSPLIVERYQDPTGTINTRAQLKEYFLLGLSNNPNLKFELIDSSVGVNALTLYYFNAKGGKTMEYFEFNSQAKVVKSFSCYSQ